MEFVDDPLTNPDLVTQVRINTMGINRLSRRKRGMASNPLFIIPEFFLYFLNELCYGYIRFEENGKFLWEGREKKFAQLAVSV